MTRAKASQNATRESAGAVRRVGQQLRMRARQLILHAAAGRRARAGVRVLVYHVMPPPDVFRAHMDAVRSVAEIIDESELLPNLRQAVSRATDECKVLVTFDDGYQQCVDEPSLALTRELAVRPLLFVVAAAVDPTLGPSSRLIRDSAGIAYRLSAVDSLRRAMSSGWSIGSHTSTHWDCGRGSRAELHGEIAGSKRALESALEVEVRSFAYPFGRRSNVSPQAEECLRESGYVAAFTTQRGVIRADDDGSPFLLPRDVVETWWGPKELAGCLAGALDRIPKWH